MKKEYLIGYVIMLLIMYSAIYSKKSDFGLDSNWSCSWPFDSTKTLPRFECIDFLDSLHGMVGANFLHNNFSPSIIRTTDGGNSWVEVFHDSTRKSFDSSLNEWVVDHKEGMIRDIVY